MNQYISRQRKINEHTSDEHQSRLLQPLEEDHSLATMGTCQQNEDRAGLNILGIGHLLPVSRLLSSVCSLVTMIALRYRWDYSE